MCWTVVGAGVLFQVCRNRVLGLSPRQACDAAEEKTPHVGPPLLAV